MLSDGVADPPFPTPPNTFTRFFFTKTPLPKQDPILPEMEFLLVTKTCTRFVVEQVQDEIVRSFCFNNSEIALSIHNTHNKNAVATSVYVL